MFRVAAAKFVRPAASRAYCIPITNVCREWRCKVDGEATAEKLEKIVDETKSSLPKGATVQRLVCKAEWDYKVHTGTCIFSIGCMEENTSSHSHRS